MNAYEYFLTLKKQLELTEEEEMALNRREATISDVFYMQGLNRQENMLYSLFCRRFTPDNIKRIMRFSEMNYRCILSKVCSKLFPDIKKEDGNEKWLQNYIEENIYGEEIN